MRDIEFGGAYDVVNEALAKGAIFKEGGGCGLIIIRLSDTDELAGPPEPVDIEPQGAGSGGGEYKRGR